LVANTHVAFTSVCISFASTIVNVPDYVKTLNIAWVSGFAVWLSIVGAACFCYSCWISRCSRCCGVDNANRCSRFLSHFLLTAYGADGKVTVPVNTLVLVALILPFNTLWFYKYTGNPVLSEDCILYKEVGGTIMQNAVGELFPPVSWIDAPFDKDSIPAQPGCSSVVGTLAGDYFGFNDDRYEELYELEIRFFGFIIGAFAETCYSIASLSGNFMADLTDIYDLFVMSFASTNLMKEGKLPFCTQSLDTVIFTSLLVAYCLIVLRFVIPLKFKDWKVCGRFNMSDPIIGSFLSLCQEVMFFTVRIWAWGVFEVPISILMLKNIACGFFDCCEIIDACKARRTAPGLAALPQRGVV